MDPFVHIFNKPCLNLKHSIQFEQKGWHVIIICVSQLNNNKFNIGDYS